MGVTHITAEEIRKHLPARILSLGYPDHLHDNVDLTGSELGCVDIIQHHGSERIVDLSVLQDLGTFDLVIDCGTLEHCANPAHGFINAASSLRVGGHVIHQLPLNMINHGYWNICPIWFTDFYRHNNFVIERLEMNINGSYHDCSSAPWPGGDPNRDGLMIPEPALTLCVARRTNGDPITLPRCQGRWTE